MHRVVYSKRKTISITVRDGNVIVRAPYKTPSQVIEDCLKKHRRWIDNRVKSQTQRISLTNELTPDDIRVLKINALDYFVKKAELYSNIMGLKYSRIKITSAKRRFGSCNSNGVICFSHLLMLYPEPAREYVVVHELAHLKHMNHSSDFYQLVAAYMPDYKERKLLLK